MANLTQMNCPHGINIKHKRCYDCEDIAAAELRAHTTNKREGISRRINKARKPTRRYFGR